MLVFLNPPRSARSPCRRLDAALIICRSLGVFPEAWKGGFFGRYLEDSEERVEFNGRELSK